MTDISKEGPERKIQPGDWMRGFQWEGPGPSTNVGSEEVQGPSLHRHKQKAETRRLYSVGQCYSQESPLIGDLFLLRKNQ